MISSRMLEYQLDISGNYDNDDNGGAAAAAGNN